jgi:hypothetical protein
MRFSPESCERRSPAELPTGSLLQWSCHDRTPDARERFFSKVAEGTRIRRGVYPVAERENLKPEKSQAPCESISQGESREDAA